MATNQVLQQAAERQVSSNIRKVIGRDSSGNINRVTYRTIGPDQFGNTLSYDQQVYYLNPDGSVTNEYRSILGKNAKADRSRMRGEVGGGFKVVATSISKYDPSGASQTSRYREGGSLKQTESVSSSGVSTIQKYLEPVKTTKDQMEQRQKIQEASNAAALLASKNAQLKQTAYNRAAANMQRKINEVAKVNSRQDFAAALFKKQGLNTKIDAGGVLVTTDKKGKFVAAVDRVGGFAKPSAIVKRVKAKDYSFVGPMPRGGTTFSRLRSGFETTVQKRIKEAKAASTYILKKQRDGKQLTVKDRSIMALAAMNSAGFQFVQGLTSPVLRPKETVIGTLKGIGSLVTNPEATLRSIGQVIKSDPAGFVTSTMGTTMLLGGLGRAAKITSKTVKAAPAVVKSAGKTGAATAKQIIKAGKTKIIVDTVAKASKSGKVNLYLRISSKTPGKKTITQVIKKGTQRIVQRASSAVKRPGQVLRSTINKVKTNKSVASQKLIMIKTLEQGIKNLRKIQKKGGYIGSAKIKLKRGTPEYKRLTSNIKKMRQEARSLNKEVDKLVSKPTKARLKAKAKTRSQLSREYTQRLTEDMRKWRARIDKAVASRPSTVTPYVLQNVKKLSPSQIARLVIKGKISQKTLRKLPSSVRKKIRQFTDKHGKAGSKSLSRFAKNKKEKLKKQIIYEIFKVKEASRSIDKVLAKELSRDLAKITKKSLESKTLKGLTRIYEMLKSKQKLITGPKQRMMLSYQPAPTKAIIDKSVAIIKNKKMTVTQKMKALSRLSKKSKNMSDKEFVKQLIMRAGKEAKIQKLRKMAMESVKAAEKFEVKIDGKKVLKKKMSLVRKRQPNAKPVEVSDGQMVQILKPQKVKISDTMRSMKRARKRSSYNRYKRIAKKYIKKEKAAVSKLQQILETPGKPKNPKLEQIFKTPGKPKNPKLQQILKTPGKPKYPKLEQILKTPGKPKNPKLRAIARLKIASLATVINTLRLIDKRKTDSFAKSRIVAATTTRQKQKAATRTIQAQKTNIKQIQIPKSVIVPKIVSKLGEKTIAAQITKITALLTAAGGATLLRGLPKKFPTKESLISGYRQYKARMYSLFRRKSFNFTPSLAAIILGEKATRAEMRNLLRKGRYFTGFESRKLTK